MTKITDLHKLWLKRTGYRKVFNNSEATFKVTWKHIQARNKTAKASVIKNFIQTDEEHDLALKELLRLFDLNPEVGSPDGGRLEELVILVHAYEVIHYPIDANTQDIRTSYDSEFADPIEKSVGNVYADLKFPDADQMLRKAYLVSKISELILSKRLNEDEVASLLGISKTNLSKILKGQFRGVSEEELSSHLKQVQIARAC